MRTTTFLVIGCTLILSFGCTPGQMISAGKAGLKVVKGAEAQIIPVEDVSATLLKSYGTVKLGEVTTDVGSICTPTCLNGIRQAMKEVFAKELAEAYPGKDKTLVVNIVCRFFKEKGLFGKKPRLDLLAILVDGESNEELARLYIEGISKSPVAGKLKHLAKENAEELAKFLVKRKEVKK